MKKVNQSKLITIPYLFFNLLRSIFVSNLSDSRIKAQNNACLSNKARFLTFLTNVRESIRELHYKRHDDRYKNDDFGSKYYDMLEKSDSGFGLKAMLIGQLEKDDESAMEISPNDITIEVDIDDFFIELTVCFSQIFF